MRAYSSLINRKSRTAWSFCPYLVSLIGCCFVLTVIDSSGRPAAGTLEGTLSDFGNYDECLKIRLLDDYNGEETFRGKYCTLKFAAPMPPKPERLNYHQDLFNATLEEGGVRTFIYTLIFLVA